MSILHPTTAESREHHRYQRKLMAMGIIPPLEATKPRKCKCGATWNPGNCGVVRWAIDGRVLWVSTCPECHSTQTTYERED